MKRFESIDISGDAGIRAFGDTVEDMFANAAIGMYSLITDPEGVEEKEEMPVEVEGHSMEGLLVSYLNELIFRFDTYGFVGRRVIIAEITPSLTLSPRGEGTGEGEVFKVRGTVSGEEFDPERHERRLLIKAATYHMLKIEKKEGQWVADVIFDI